MADIVVNVEEQMACIIAIAVMMERFCHIDPSPSF